MRFFCISILLAIAIPLSAQYDSLSHGGQQRYFLQHLPTGYTGSNSYSLIIAMHGGFGSAFNLQDQSQLSVKADQDGFIVVYPEGVKSPIGIRTWNAGGCCGYAMNQNIDDVGFINRLLDTLIQRFSVDTNRIYATGMSNGGFMSYRLACELPERFAAIAPVASSMFTNCSPSIGVPVIHFHSYADSNVPHLGGYGNGVSTHYNPPLDSVLNVWAGFNECITLQDTLRDGNDYDHIVWTDCKCDWDVEWYITHDGGHSWPGGNKTVIGDTVSVYISANDLMWDFFQAHPNCLATGVNQRPTPDGQKVFPNPTSGLIHIQLLERASRLVSVYSLDGQLMVTKEIHGSGRLDLSQLSPGLYMVQIDGTNTRLIYKE